MLKKRAPFFYNFQFFLILFAIIGILSVQPLFAETQTEFENEGETELMGLRLTKDYYFSPFGSATATVQRELWGSEASVISQNFTSKDNAVAYLQNLVAEDFGEGQLLEYQQSKIPEANNGLFSFQYKVKKVGTANSDFFHCQFFILPAQILHSLPAPFLDEEAYKNEGERKEPYFVKKEIDAEWIYRVHIPKNFIVEEMPSSERWQIGPIELLQTVLREENLLIVKNRVQMKAGALSAEDFNSLRENALSFYKEKIFIPVKLVHYAEVLWDKAQYSDAFEWMHQQRDSFRYAQKALSLRLGTKARSELNVALLEVQKGKLEIESETEAYLWYLWGLAHKVDEFGQTNYDRVQLEIAKQAFMKAVELEPQNELFINECYDFFKNYFPEELTAFLLSHPELKEMGYEIDRYVVEDAILRQDWEFLGDYLKEHQDFSEFEFVQLFYEAKQKSEADDSLSIEDSLFPSFFEKYAEDQLRLKAGAYLIRLLSFSDEYWVARKLLDSLLTQFPESDYLKNYQPLLDGTYPLEFLFETHRDNPTQIFVYQFFNELFNSDGADFSSMKDFFSPSIYTAMQTQEAQMGFPLLYELFVLGQGGKGQNRRMALNFFLSKMEMSYQQFGKRLSAVQLEFGNLGYTGEILFYLMDGKIIAFDEQRVGFGEAIYRLYCEGEDLTEFFESYYLNEGVILSDDPLAFTETEDLIFEIMIFTGAEEKAISYFERRIKNIAKIDSQNTANEMVACKYALAHSYLLQRNKKAVPLYEELCKLEPDKLNFWLQRLESFFIDDPKGEAAKVFLDNLPDSDLFDEEFIDFMYYHYYSLLADQKAFADYVDAKVQAKTVSYSDYNLLAWLGVLKGTHPTERDKLYARKAVELSESKVSAIVHTQACLFALEGKIKKAISIFNQRIEKSNYNRYLNEDWFLYGLIADALGEKEAAKRAFEKITSEVDWINYPTSCKAFADRAQYRY